MVCSIFLLMAKNRKVFTFWVIDFSACVLAPFLSFSRSLSLSLFCLIRCDYFGVDRHISNMQGCWVWVVRGGPVDIFSHKPANIVAPWNVFNNVKKKKLKTNQLTIHLSIHPADQSNWPSKWTNWIGFDCVAIYFHELSLFSRPLSNSLN